MMYEQYADELAQKGYTVINDFLSRDAVALIRAEMMHLLDLDKFKQAGIGEEKRTIEEVRGDQILWISDEPQPGIMGEVPEKMNEVRQFFNRALYLGINSSEFHFAYYASGKYYRKHLDNVDGKNNRIVSVLLYLNEPDRQADEGGLLRLYLPDGQVRDVVPAGGTLACFLSREIPHEVTATLTPRYSITGWWRRDELLPGF